MLNQIQKIKLALFYHEQAYKACINDSDFFRAKRLYEKTIELNPADEIAQFNLDIIKVVT